MGIINSIESNPWVIGLNLNQILALKQRCGTPRYKYGSKNVSTISKQIFHLKKQTIFKCIFDDYFPLRFAPKLG